MAKGDKYIALTAYFRDCNQSMTHMSFQKIESIIGTNLPVSAYKYPAFWSNSESHMIGISWLSNGYKSQNVNMTNQTIEFVKVDRL